PLRRPSASRKSEADTYAPSYSVSSATALAVPPVAITSSTISTRSPGCSASLCISRWSSPYSSAYETLTVGAGSLPSLRTGTKPAPRRSARRLPRMKPRLSIATTLSAGRPWQRATSSSVARRKSTGSLSSVVMSLKTIPFCGKSGPSGIAAFRVSTPVFVLIALLGSSDVEPLVPARGDRRAIEVLDRRERRPLAQPLLEAREHVVGGLRHDLDRAVR